MSVLGCVVNLDMHVIVRSGSGGIRPGCKAWSAGIPKLMPSTEHGVLEDLVSAACSDASLPHGFYSVWPCSLPIVPGASLRSIARY